MNLLDEKRATGCTAQSDRSERHAEIQPLAGSDAVCLTDCLKRRVSLARYDFSSETRRVPRLRG